MLLKAHMRLCQRCLWCYRSGLCLRSLSTVYRSGGNYYELLGVKPDASMEEIKNAFFNKSKKLHPDSDLSNPGLHSQFVALSEAYRVLSREALRKEYDQCLRQPAPSSRQTFSTKSSENMRYWEQFRYATPQEYSTEQLKKKKKLNMHLVGYCLVAMLASLAVHYFGFRKLEEIHNSFMDEKDRAITEIYNDSKERARANGFKRQTEILRQKHAEFLEKYKVRSGADDDK
ncbi:dnaJ homolog subfamily C member 4 [Conger conger]|nr:dnaJ homolog subfamily C member 4 [Conger conger]